jgi:hypothetical protein
MHELELEPVGVVEEHRVVARLVPVGLGAALDLGVVGTEPFRPLVDGRPRRDLEGDVVETDAVAVVLTFARGGGLAQAEGAVRAVQVVDRLAPFAFDLAVTVPAERAEQLTVEGQAPLDRRDDEVDVMKAGGAQ